MATPSEPESLRAAEEQVVLEQQLGEAQAAQAAAAGEPQAIVDKLGFETALLMLKAGKRVQRAGWNGAGMWLEIVVPHDSVYLPFIQMFTAQKTYVPWLASQTDLLSHDWRMLSDPDVG